MQPFEYNANAARVLFGPGTLAQLPAELTTLHVTRALVVCTSGGSALGARASALLGPLSAGVFAEATLHTPRAVTLRAVAAAKAAGADGVVSVGGGSAVGLGKAVGVELGLPHVTAPTTYAGSEMTAILGETEDGVKRTRSDPGILPRVVVYDVELTMGLSAAVSAVSGVNALAHAAEALYAKNSNPVVSLIALDGARAIATYLPHVVADTADVEARSQVLYGAWLCSLSIGTVNVGLQHKLAHTVGGSFNLPHAEVHTILLPHTMAFNTPAAPEAMKRLAEVLPGSEGDPVKGLNILLSRLGVKRGLKELGMREEDVPKAAEIAVSNPYWNPRPLEQDKLQEVIRRAWAGEPARADL